MKKILAILLLATFVAPVFADDANVLPAGVLRVYGVPTLSLVNGVWDEDGELTSNKGNGGDNQPDDPIFALGGAAEYGITDQISLGLQWTPVYQFLTAADAADNPGLEAIGGDGDVLTGGIDAVDVGAEIQVLGQQGYVLNEVMRFSVTPGIGVPMPTRDWAAEGEAAVDGDDYVGPSAENLTRFAAGALVNFDYFVTPEFYVNVFAEPRYRFGRTVDYSDFYNEVGRAVFNASAPSLATEDDPYDKYETEYGSDLQLETGIDFNYALPVSETLRLDFGLPAVFQLVTPREDTTTIEISSEAETINQTLESFGQDVAFQSAEIKTEPDDPSYTLYVNPSVGAFITALPVPLEFVGEYRIPVLGQNATAVQTFVLQARAYLRF